MTTIHSGDIDCPIAPFLSISSARLRSKRLIRTLSNRMRSEMEKQRLNSYWPSDDNDDTDEDLQKDPPEALIDDNYTHKTYTYVSF